MDPSAAADEKRQDEEEELDLLLIALQEHMDSLMTLAKDAVAFTGGGTGKPRKGRRGKRR